MIKKIAYKDLYNLEGKQKYWEIILEEDIFHIIILYYLIFCKGQEPCVIRYSIRKEGFYIACKRYVYADPMVNNYDYFRYLLVSLIIIHFFILFYYNLIMIIEVIDYILKILPEINKHIEELIKYKTYYFFIKL